MIRRITIHSGICTYVPAYICLPEHTLQAWTYKGAEQKRPDSAERANCDSAEQTPKMVLIDCSEYDADKHLKRRHHSKKPFLVWWICIIDCPMLVFATQSRLMLHNKLETPLPSPTPVQCIPLSLCKPWPCWNTSSTPSQNMDFWQSVHSCCHMPVNAVARKCKHNKCTCSECKISKQSSCKDCLFQKQEVPNLTAKMLSTQSCSECKIPQQSSCKDSISKQQQVPNFNCKDAFDTDSENWVWNWVLRVSQSQTLSAEPDNAMLRFKLTESRKNYWIAPKQMQMIQTSNHDAKMLKLKQQILQKTASLLFKHTVFKTTIQHQCTIWVWVRV